MNSSILNNGLVRLEIKEGKFSFFDPHTDCGWKRMCFKTLFNQGKCGASTDFRLYPDSGIKEEKIRGKIGEGKKIIVNLSGRDNFPDEEYQFSLYKGKKILLIQHNIKNSTSKVVSVERTLDFGNDGSGEIKVGKGEICFFHVENIRKLYLHLLRDKMNEFSNVVEGKSYYKKIGKKEKVGDSEDQPFPGLLFCSLEHKGGLIDAVISQEKRYRIVEFGREENDAEGMISKYEPCMMTKGINSISLSPGEMLEGEQVYLEITESNDPQRAFSNYLETLSQIYQFWGPRSTLQHSAVWGSFNLGIWHNISEELILRNVDYVKKHFPTVKWIQIDDGYDRFVDREWFGGIGFAYNGAEAGVDKEKFPHGMAYIAEQIKERDLHPAIWVGLTTGDACPLVTEHPDWFLKDEQGEFIDAGMKRIIDPSVPEARDYIHEVFKTIIIDWGYEGIKLDFWSYAFENIQMVYKNKEKSSLEWRSWLLKDIRSMLPEYGYIQTGCDIAMGNPFLGLFCDNYRYGLDVAEGDWGNLVKSIRWAGALMFITGNRFILPNSDAIGAMENLSEDEMRTWLTFCLVSGTSLELGGDLPFQDQKRLRYAQKVLSGLDNGREAYVAGLHQKYSGMVAPEIWCTGKRQFPLGKGPKTERIMEGRLIAVFNWEEKERSKRVDLGEIGLASGKRHRCVDFWTGEEFALVSSNFEVKLPPHGVKAFLVL